MDHLLPFYASSVYLYIHQLFKYRSLKPHALDNRAKRNGYGFTSTFTHNGDIVCALRENSIQLLTVIQLHR